MSARKIISCHVLWRELCQLAAQSSHVFDFQFLEQGLHDTPDQLRAQLQAAIDATDGVANAGAAQAAATAGATGATGATATPGPPKSSGAPGGLTAATDGAARKLSAARKRSSPARMGRHANAYDAILLGYGLCSNGIAGIEARRTPLVVVRGHDCITHLIGSRQRYREYFDAHPGTYWYSPGWIDTGSQPGQARYERTLQAYVDRYGADNAKYLMDMEQGWFKSYSFATYVDLGIGGGDAGKEYTRSCAQWLGWQYDELQGDPGLLTRFVNGDWESDDFLIVQPGQKIVPSYDERVIRAEDGHPAAPAE